MKSAEQLLVAFDYCLLNWGLSLAVAGISTAPEQE